MARIQMEMLLSA